MSRIHRISWLPRGHALPGAVWASRHRWVVSVLAAQTLLLPLFALLRGSPPEHALVEPLVPAGMAALACWPRLGRQLRSALAATGLMVVSGIVVHLSGGATEAHFHFFVMVPIVALYESWFPFSLAIGYVLVQHGVVGTLNSSTVYGHPAAHEHPWLWAAIHSALFAAACMGALVNWKLHEGARKEASDLSHRATHDALTGLPNRTLFQHRVAEALRAVHGGVAQPTVLLLDLDGFKEVNDTLGHHHGDLVLIEVAARLRRALRDDDTVSRLGGDEFAMLLPRSPAGSGEKAAVRITEALTVPFLIEGASLDLEVSIGVATGGPGEDAVTLVRHADAAMYVAKQRKLGYTRYDRDAEEHGKDSTRHQLLGDLRLALDRGEIVLHYQPKIGVASGQVVGVEALARWEHPTRGLVGPAEFIPLLEATTLSHRFTAEVLSMALTQARGWVDGGVRLTVAVNVSTVCMLNPRFVDTVASTLQKVGVPGDLLCIEITEDAVLVEPARAIHVLGALRALGVRTSIDDFGTGYSSMSYLQMLPVDELKIDKSFVRDMAVKPTDRVLVTSAIELGHSLGLTVVAEGVEDLAVVVALQDLGCDVAQGYHFARPLPPAEFTSWYDAQVRGLMPQPRLASASPAT